MTGSDVTGSSATSNTYDALGNRTTVATVTGAGTDTTAMSWDNNNPLPMLAVATGPDDDERGYSYAPSGELLQTQHPDEAYPRSFHATDALGSVTDTFKTDGTPTEQTTYDAYGNVTVTSVSGGTVMPDLGYTGGYNDSTTGDLYLRARNYVPATGRFTSLDPLAQSAGSPSISAFAYVGNRPLVYVDPTGMKQNVPDPGAGGYAPPAEHSCTAADNGIVSAGLHFMHVGKQALHD
jgi:RHS repeat-associated protein